jgi:hypothetical protein
MNNAPMFPNEAAIRPYRGRCYQAAEKSNRPGIWRIEGVEACQEHGSAVTGVIMRQGETRHVMPLRAFKFWIKAAKPIKPENMNAGQ